MMLVGATGVPANHGGQSLANSQGAAPVPFKAPANSCDCHTHIYDDRFPTHAGSVHEDFTAGAYRTFQQRIGTTRTVVVSPRPYVTDPQCTLDAISQLGATVTRGIAVLHPEVKDRELRRLADAGIRGIRFTLSNPAVAVTTIDMIEPLANRINELGWHVQLHMKADQIAENADLLERLASPIVFDHMARLPQPAGTRHAAFTVVRRLLDKGRTWVKLSGPFHDSKLAPPDYADVAEVAQAYIMAAPDRMVWGSDLPHRHGLPDVTLMFGLLERWAPDETTRRRILVDNPAVLYGFPECASRR